MAPDPEDGDAPEPPEQVRGPALTIGAPVRVPRILEYGGTYDPSPLRERTRSRLAQSLVFLLVVVSLLLIIFTATGLLTGDETKDLATAVLSPLVAVTGTALGFYFGGHRSGS